MLIGRVGEPPSSSAVVEGFIVRLAADVVADVNDVGDRRPRVAPLPPLSSV